MSNSQLPQFQNDDVAFQQLQNKWASILNPVLQKEIVNGRLIRNQQLLTGDNVVNHGLGRKLQGWFITRLRASAHIFDTQDTNSMPQLTLLLTSDADVVADIWCF